MHMPHRRTTRRLTTAATVLALSVGGASAAQAGGGHHGHDPDDDEFVEVADGFASPRGVDALGHGKTLVTDLVLDEEGNPTAARLSLVVERHRHHHSRSHGQGHGHGYGESKVIELGQLATGFPPAVAMGRHGVVYVLTGADNAETTADDETAARLFRWSWRTRDFEEVADIGAYQLTDPDPHNTEGSPTESNPFGLAALRYGGVLVADAAGNDLLRVSWDGEIETVARLAPRTVPVPEGLPAPPPGEGPGGELPPAGTPIEAEAVATSVTVGKDGYWYVGELRGFPGTPETSQIWRIKPGTTEATCDPEAPDEGDCRRYADGLTALVDLAPARYGVLALSLSNAGFLGLELGVEGAELGGLFWVVRGHHGTHVREIAEGQLMAPGGVDTADGDVYVVGPLLNPDGALLKLR